MGKVFQSKEVVLMLLSESQSDAKAGRRAGANAVQVCGESDISIQEEPGQ